MSGFVDLCCWGRGEREREFKKRIRAKYNTFTFLYQRLGSCTKKHDTQVRGIVPVQERVVMSFHRLGSGDGLQPIGDL
jgi:hypothetical protein